MVLFRLIAGTFMAVMLFWQAYDAYHNKFSVPGWIVLMQLGALWMFAGAAA